MTHTTRKLKSNSGASMILALALMLICVMVSSVIITSAVSGTSRTIYRTNQQQNYLAVSNAAEFIAKNLNVEEEFVGTETIGIKPCQQYANNGTTIWYDNPNTNTIENEQIPAYIVQVYPTPDTVECYIIADDEGTMLHTGENTKSIHSSTHFAGPFAEMMKAAAFEVYLTNSSYTQSFELSVTDEFNTSEDRIPQVKCTFTMDEDYYITIEVYSADEDNDYSIVIELEPTISEGENQQNTECVHRIYYKTEENGSLVNKVNNAYTFSHTVEAPEVHVTWGTPVVTKGVEQ